MSDQLTPEELKRLFPNASASTIAAQSGIRKPVLSVPVPPPVLRPKMEIGQSTDEQKLNKTERAYLAVLRAHRHPWIGIQNVTLKLADDCRLTPDFAYINEIGRMTFVDVKGFQREDALIKMKVACRQFLWADFEIVKREGSGFERIKVKP